MRTHLGKKNRIFLSFQHCKYEINMNDVEMSVEERAHLVIGVVSCRCVRFILNNLRVTCINGLYTQTAHQGK